MLNEVKHLAYGRYDTNCGRYVVGCVILNEAQRSEGSGLRPRGTFRTMPRSFAIAQDDSV